MVFGLKNCQSFVLSIYHTDHYFCPHCQSCHGSLVNRLNVFSVCLVTSILVFSQPYCSYFFMQYNSSYSISFRASCSFSLFLSSYIILTFHTNLHAHTSAFKLRSLTWWYKKYSLTLNRLILMLLLYKRRKLLYNQAKYIWIVKNVIHQWPRTSRLKIF